MSNQIKNSQVLGIDLGTTNTVAAYLDESGMPKIIPNLDGDFTTPSVCYVGPRLKDILIGKPALNMMFIEPDRTIKECKRDVGADKVYFTESGVDITPEWVQTEILKYMRKSAIQYFGDNNAGSQAVITVPAYFKENERQSVMKSAAMAGITVLQLINEPTSAGIAFGIKDVKGDKLVIVCDFGGGTYDVSAIQYSSGKADVFASCGDKHLGGKDVDDIMIAMGAEKFRDEHGLELSLQNCPSDYYGVWEEVIRQKHLLASKSEVKFPLRAQGKQVVMQLTQDDFTHAIASLTVRAKKITAEMLKDAKITAGTIDSVLLVGGSSRLKPFQEAMKELFGNGCIKGGSVSPDFAIAEGAALKAGHLIKKSNMEIIGKSNKVIPTKIVAGTDVMPHSLGIAVIDLVTHLLHCSAILPKNTAIPCMMSQDYASVDQSQTQFHIQVLQGEEGMAIQDCIVVGEKVLDLPARDPRENSFQVGMSYDDSGLVNVIVNDYVSGHKEDITVDFYQKK